MCALSGGIAHIPWLKSMTPFREIQVPFIEWILELILFEKCSVLMKVQKNQNPDV